MTDTYDKISDYRLKYLPDQLERARRRYVALVNEAQRYGLRSVLHPEEREGRTELLKHHRKD